MSIFGRFTHWLTATDTKIAVRHSHIWLSHSEIQFSTFDPFASHRFSHVFVICVWWTLFCPAEDSHSHPPRTIRPSKWGKEYTFFGLTPYVSRVLDVRVALQSDLSASMAGGLTAYIAVTICWLFLVHISSMAFVCLPFRCVSSSPKDQIDVVTILSHPSFATDYVDDPICDFVLLSFLPTVNLFLGSFCQRLDFGRCFRLRDEIVRWQCVCDSKCHLQAHRISHIAHKARQWHRQFDGELTYKDSKDIFPFSTKSWGAFWRRRRRRKPLLLEWWWHVELCRERAFVAQWRWFAISTSLHGLIMKYCEWYHRSK